MQAVRAPSRPMLRGRCVWIEPSLTLAEASQDQLALEILRGGYALCADAERHKVSLIVVAAVNNLSEVCHWNAMLCGAIVCDQEYFLAGGTRGKSISFTSAVSWKRKVWVSSSLRRQQPIVCRLVAAACAQPGSKWVNLGSRAAAIAFGKKCGVKRKSECLVLCTPREQASKDSGHPEWEGEGGE